MITRQQPNTTIPRPQIKGIYTALMSQAGTAAPTAIVIQNTLPTTGMPIWTRNTAGLYRLTSPVTGYFPIGLVTARITNNTDITNQFLIAHASTEWITIGTGLSGTYADAILAFTPIEIIIWDRLQD